jgi:transcriptional regulator with XRE-family HTH domain
MLSDRLEILRTEKGLTKKEMAEYLKIAQSTYGKYELGKREPDLETIKKLAEFFNVSVDYLIGHTHIRNVAEETCNSQNEDKEWTQEELNEIKMFKDFIKMRRKQKNKK